MTLVLTIINQYGAWQSADHRVTDWKTGKPVDDESPKQLHIAAPDGRAVIGYSGVGIYSGVVISDWLRELLRGDLERKIDHYLAILLDAANRDLGPIVDALGTVHEFSIAAFVEDMPRFSTITNALRSGRPGKAFESASFPVSDGRYDVRGDQASVPADDLSRLKKLCKRKPDDPKVFSDALREINRNASANSARKTVSPKCSSIYLAPQDAGRISTDGTLVPMLALGIDATQIFREGFARFKKAKADQAAGVGNGVWVPAPPGTKERPQVDVIPRNRLRPKKP